MAIKFSEEDLDVIGLELGKIAQHHLNALDVVNTISEKLTGTRIIKSWLPQHLSDEEQKIMEADAVENVPEELTSEFGYVTDRFGCYPRISEEELATHRESGFIGETRIG